VREVHLFSVPGVAAILPTDLGECNEVFYWLIGQLHRRAQELGCEVVKKADAASDSPVSAPVLTA